MDILDMLIIAFMGTLIIITMDTSMARDRLKLILKLLGMDMLLAMPTMVTMDTHMPTTMVITMARGLLMLTMHIMVMDVATMDTMPMVTRHMVSTATMDSLIVSMPFIINLF